MSLGVKILHLTDIHIGNKDFIYENVKHMAYRIGDEFENLDEVVDLVLITGDIFYGKTNLLQEEGRILTEACMFFETLLERLKVNSNKALTKDDFLFLPGNHDINRNAIDGSDVFDIYRKFLEKFYGNKLKVYELYNEDFLYRIKIYNEKHIIIAGLNSCKFEKYIPKVEDTEWIEGIDFSSISSLDVNISKDVKNIIHSSQYNLLKNNYYDYGFISPEQFVKFKDELKRRINDFSDYSTIVAFHHHFYMFPELYGKNGDLSLLKNFESITSQLSKFNTKIIIHGHKHLQLITPILTEDYLKKPSKLMYALSGGNIGDRSQWNGNFQVIEVFNHNELSKIAKILPFEYIGEKLKILEPIVLPPQTIDESGVEEKLGNILKTEKEELYFRYEDKISDIDKISMQLDFEKIITCLSNVLTSFNDIKRDLHKSPDQVMWILLFTHFKIVSLAIIYNKSYMSNDIREDIKEFFKKENKESSKFIDLVFNFLEEKNELKKDKYYDILNNMNLTSKQRKIKAYAIVVDIFVELFLVLSVFADDYYEQFSYKVNIKLDKNLFNKNVSSKYIEFNTKIDQRTVFINLKCKHPTCHKIIVLFIKIFENKLAKYGKDFDAISLKIFYIRPNITKSSEYQLDDYNFEAYIPSLLPLLIGENIYKQKEVFIRELIQNSIDAILLRQEISANLGSFEKCIKISYNKEDENNKQESEHIEPHEFLIIQDNGIGMTISQVERYFIHIGRSYYGSQEYNELAEKNDLSYKPISKFGIGFLSSFLFAKDIRVYTRSYLLDEQAVDIYIPNHEGCFFSKKSDLIKDVGTKMILYKDKNSNINVDSIIKYLKENILDIQLDIELTYKTFDSQKIFKLEAFQLRKNLKSLPITNNPIFFIPLDKNGVKYRDFNDTELYDNEPFGILIQYTDNVDYWKNNKGKYLELNSGILLQHGSDDTSNYRLNNSFIEITINFPPNYIELDVSREKISKFLLLEDSNNTFNSKDFRKTIMEVYKSQFMQWFHLAKIGKFNVTIGKLYRYIDFLIQNDIKEIDDININLYLLSLKLNNNSFIFEMVDNKLKTIYDNKSSNHFINSPSNTIEVLFNNLQFFISNLITNIFKDEHFKDLYSIKYSKEEFEILSNKIIQIKDKLIYIKLSKAELINLTLEYMRIFEHSYREAITSNYFGNNINTSNYIDDNKLNVFEKQFLSEIKSNKLRTQLIKKNLPSKTYTILNSLIWDLIDYTFFSILIFFHTTTIKNIEEKKSKRIISLAAFLGRFLKNK